MSNYAVVQTGGKQYRVSPGDVIRVETLDASPGDTVELTDVRLVAQDDSVVVGTPQVAGARVTAEVQNHDKAKKVVVFRFKPKVRHRKKQGHRQPYTALRVTGIQAGGS